MVTFGDSTGLYKVRYNVETGTDTITYVLWMGTNNDSYQNVTIDAGSSIAWAEKVTMLAGDKDGVHTPLTPSGNTVDAGSVGETPVYVRYKLGAAPAGGGALRTRFYRVQ